MQDAPDLTRIPLTPSERATMQQTAAYLDRARALVTRYLAEQAAADD